MRVAIKLFILSLALCAPSFSQQSQTASPRLTGPYLGQKPPGEVAELFAPGIVSTRYFEHSSPVFTPDLKEIYWSTQIYDENGTDTARPIFYMKEINGVWSKPEVPPFAKPFACSENPFIAPDGKRLFFHASHTIRPEKVAIYFVHSGREDSAAETCIFRSNRKTVPGARSSTWGIRSTRRRMKDSPT